MENWRPPHHEALGACDPLRSAGAPAHQALRCHLSGLATAFRRGPSMTPAEPLYARARTAAAGAGVAADSDSAEEATTSATVGHSSHPDGTSDARAGPAAHGHAERPVRAKDSLEAKKEAAFIKRQVSSIVPVAARRCSADQCAFDVGRSS